MRTDYTLGRYASGRPVGQRLRHSRVGGREPRVPAFGPRHPTSAQDRASPGPEARSPASPADPISGVEAVPRGTFPSGLPSERAFQRTRDPSSGESSVGSTDHRSNCSDRRRPDRCHAQTRPGRGHRLAPAYVILADADIPSPASISDESLGHHYQQPSLHRACGASLAACTNAGIRRERVWQDLPPGRHLCAGARQIVPHT
jgi:hypothetical protein